MPNQKLNIRKVDVVGIIPLHVEKRKIFPVKLMMRTDERRPDTRLADPVFEITGQHARHMLVVGANQIVIFVEKKNFILEFIAEIHVKTVRAHFPPVWVKFEPVIKINP
jgi:hypothetical protein